MIKQAKLTVFVALALAGVASASGLNGTYGFIPVGTITYSPSSPSDLFSATSIAIPSIEMVNSIQCTYLGNPNDFSFTGNGCTPNTNGAEPMSLLSFLTFSNDNLDLSFGSLPTITWSDKNSDTLSFAATSGVKVDTTAGGAENVLVYYLGDFSVNSGPGTTASVSLAFTQTGGPTGTVNFAGTFADPPQANPGTPEPSTMVLLGGALVGLGAAGRKKLGR